MTLGMANEQNEPLLSVTNQAVSLATTSKITFPMLIMVKFTGRNSDLTENIGLPSSPYSCKMSFSNWAVMLLAIPLGTTFY